MKALLIRRNGEQIEADISDPPKPYVLVPTAEEYGLLNPPPVDERGVPIFRRLRFKLEGVVAGKAIYVEVEE